MAYESKSFKEHHLTRLPVLEKLLSLGWEREQMTNPAAGVLSTRRQPSGLIGAFLCGSFLTPMTIADAGLPSLKKPDQRPTITSGSAVICISG